MSPKQARRILREMNRRERRDTFRGIYKFRVPPSAWWLIDRHGIPRPAVSPPMLFHRKTGLGVDLVAGHA